MAAPLKYHWQAMGKKPVTAALKVTGLPTRIVWLEGWLVICGGRAVPMPKVWLAAQPETTVASAMPVTGTGLVRSVMVPSPNWPLPLAPIAHSVLSSFRNREWFCPAATDTTLLATDTGLFNARTAPSPNWPELLKPIPHNVPSPFKNRE